MTRWRNLAGQPRSLVQSLHAGAMVVAAALGASPGGADAFAAAPAEPSAAQPAIARLIQRAGATHDEMERLRLFRQLDARADLTELFLLSPGEYELILTVAGAANASLLERRAVRVGSPRVRVTRQLPPRRLCLVKVFRR